MVNIITIMVVTVFATIVFGGLGYWLWLRTRPKKQTWNIDLYQLGEGVRPPKTDPKTGQVLSKIETQDLIPYAKDIVEKIDKEPGITLYRLQKLNKTCPPIESNMVEYWGENKSWVTGLLCGDEIFLMKKGFNKTTGEVLMEPMSQSRMNLIKGEMAIRKERLTKSKDILQSITPWIVTVIWMIGFVMLGYIMVSGFIEISENLKDASANFAEETQNKIKQDQGRDKEAELGLQKAIEKARQEERDKLKKEQNKTEVPMVEG
jgi:hypothetical protein